MKVRELIEKLQDMPPDADVMHIWDGAARTEINFVWVSKSGKVMTADYGQVVYRDVSRPLGAEDEKANRYWQTPDAPENEAAGDVEEL